MKLCIYVYIYVHTHIYIYRYIYIYIYSMSNKKNVDMRRTWSCKTSNFKKLHYATFHREDQVASYHQQILPALQMKHLPTTERHFGENHLYWHVVANPFSMISANFPTFWHCFKLLPLFKTKEITTTNAISTYGYTRIFKIHSKGVIHPPVKPVQQNKIGQHVLAGAEIWNLIEQ
jgi:hypothetical protein